MKERLVGLVLGLVLGVALTNIFMTPHSGSGAGKEPGDAAPPHDVLMRGEIQPAGSARSGGISLVAFAEMPGWEVTVTQGTESGFNYIECRDPIIQPDEKRILCER